MDDTIAAISTPPGEGGIGIIRLSGKGAIAIADDLFVCGKGDTGGKGAKLEKCGKAASSIASHSVTYGHIMDGQEVLDEVILTIMRAPHSYTREDVVEINCHGGLMPLRRVLDAVLRGGARLASPGEFTLRAYLNGRIDLTQAEAVCDVIRARTQQSAAVAFQQLSGGLSQRLDAISDSLVRVCAHVEAYIDFPDEDIEPSTYEEILNHLHGLRGDLSELSSTYERGRFLREGLSVAIAGRPNVGKSSLLNALVQRDRAIVTAFPGTTRDTIEEYINVEGIPVRIIDTAGIRAAADDPAECEGVNRSIMAIEAADLVLVVFDGTQDALMDEDISVIDKASAKTVIAVINKADLPIVLSSQIIRDAFKGDLPIVTLSAKTGQGLEGLRQAIFDLTMRCGCTSDKRCGGPCDKKGVLDSREGVLITNIRHKTAIDNTISALTQAINCLRGNTPIEITALELRSALNYIGEITGVVTATDILNKIFSDFCIGK
ncbi:MAG: tRNA uridine-5-carboxymethylaminomethyl(34) synthesis GTPase MnmE [Nitrospirae bacterium]|nr:tRNA uridine-5-carboxymethylaminomethyl(34) synthesis GTPase MnmE [Nitrospirota bacterium]MBF0591102.1 tRNA uridine-5-carboxymethylaminomethyl(34) synthesis GTPase MnmE [Nitrospirota bacterium]